MSAAYGLTFLAVLIFGGSTVARLTFQGAPDAAAASRARAWGVAASILLLLAAFARLGAQVAAFLDPGDAPSWETVRALLSTAWGRAWSWQVGAAGVAIALAPLHRWIAVACAGLVGATLPLTGHAVEFASGPIPGVAIMTVHVLGGSFWLGALAVILLCWRAGTPESGAHARLARAIHRFSPIALACATALTLSGVLASVRLVGSWEALLRTDYGLLLTLKIGATGGVLALGAYNWRAVRRSLGDADGSRRLARAAAWEVGLALLILALTGSLVNTEAPGL